MYVKYRCIMYMSTTSTLHVHIILDPSASFTLHLPHHHHTRRPDSSVARPARGCGHAGCDSMLARAAADPRLTGIVRGAHPALPASAAAARSWIAAGSGCAAMN